VSHVFCVIAKERIKHLVTIYKETLDNFMNATKYDIKSSTTLPKLMDEWGFVDTLREIQHIIPKMIYLAQCYTLRDGYLSIVAYQ